MSATTSGRSTRIALLPWGTPIEVFLDPIGKSLDDFCDNLAGGWLFGYAEALRNAGHEPSIVLASRAVEHETTRLHAATTTPVVVLPAHRSASRPPDAAPAGQARKQPSPHKPGVRRDISQYRRAVVPGLLRVLGQYDVVLVQEYEEPRADLLAWWGRKKGVAMMASFQGGIPPWEPAPVQNLVRSRSMRQFAALLVGSAAEADRLVSGRGVHPSRVHRVVNPVDTVSWTPTDRTPARARLGIPREAFVAAWHGRVEIWRKGLDVLIDAWAGLCAQRPHAELRLLLAGTGADEQRLRSLLNTPGLRGVDWLAEYAGAGEVRERLGACDVWVSASRLEGFAVAPLEAMASGRPVVLSDAQGVEDLIGGSGSHGGVVTPCADTPALTAALVDAYDNAGQLDDRGRAARRHVEQGFSIEAVTGQLADAVTAAVAVRRSHRPRR